MIQSPTDGGQRGYRGGTRQRYCYRWLSSGICRIPAYESRVFPRQQGWDVYSWLAVAGLAPIVASLVAAWMCIDGLQGGKWEAEHALLMLKIAIALTGGYAIISAVLTFLPRK